MSVYAISYALLVANVIGVRTQFWGQIKSALDDGLDALGDLSDDVVKQIDKLSPLAEKVGYDDELDRLSDTVE